MYNAGALVVYLYTSPARERSEKAEKPPCSPLYIYIYAHPTYQRKSPRRHTDTSTAFSLVFVHSTTHLHTYYILLSRRLARPLSSRLKIERERVVRESAAWRRSLVPRIPSCPSSATPLFRFTHTHARARERLCCCALLLRSLSWRGAQFSSFGYSAGSTPPRAANTRYGQYLHIYHTLPRVIAIACVYYTHAQWFIRVFAIRLLLCIYYTCIAVYTCVCYYNIIHRRRKKK